MDCVDTTATGPSIQYTPAILAVGRHPVHTCHYGGVEGVHAC